MLVDTEEEFAGDCDGVDDLTMEILEFAPNFAMLGAADAAVEGFIDEEGENEMELFKLPSLLSLEEAEELMGLACCWGTSCFFSTETDPKLMLELVNSLLGRLVD